MTVYEEHNTAPLNADDLNIRRAFEADPQDGFRRLVERYSQPLYWHIRRMVVSHDDADDALQETFIRAWKNISSFRWESGLHSWLLKIATNESLRLINRRKLQPAALLESETRHAAASHVDFDNEVAVNFQRAIQTLPEKQRIVFLLRYYDEKEFGEIASIAEMSEDSARVNYSHAKKRIKEFMTENIIGS